MMALIDCPECGAKVSDSAPACPKCGFPIAANIAKTMATAPSEPTEQPEVAATAATPEATAPAAEPPLLPTERSAEPLRIAGRRIPIAALLFWGGITVGVVLRYAAGDEAAETYRYVPYTMIFGGIFWFAATEFIMLVRHRQRK
jgi:hypothetical protein